MAKAWKDKWERRDELLAESNQGRAYRARKKDDPPGTHAYVLKELKQNNKPIARKRLANEAAALKSLSTSGAVRFVETNADDVDQDLYIVTEFVDGVSLDALVSQRGPLSLADALSIVIPLVHTLKECHDLLIVHRDIKPCHVICEGGDLTKPVLIDFGLAYLAENSEDSVATEPDHGVGNRFIILPEQQHGSEHQKRDPRSDVTQVVGILLYLTTGKIPRAIFGPHAFKASETTISQVKSATENQKKLLLHVVSKGLAELIDKRWQSAGDLLECLERLKDPRCDDIASIRLSRTLASAIEKFEAAPENISARLASDFTKLLNDEFIALARQLHDEHQDRMTLSFTGSGRGGDATHFLSVGLIIKTSSIKHTQCRIEVQVLHGAIQIAWTIDRETSSRPQISYENDFAHRSHRLFDLKAFSPEKEARTIVHDVVGLMAEECLKTKN